VWHRPPCIYRGAGLLPRRSVRAEGGKDRSAEGMRKRGDGGAAGRRLVVAAVWPGWALGDRVRAWPGQCVRSGSGPRGPRRSRAAAETFAGSAEGDGVCSHTWYGRHVSSTAWSWMAGERTHFHVSAVVARQSKAGRPDGARSTHARESGFQGWSGFILSLRLGAAPGHADWSWGPEGRWRYRRSRWHGPCRCRGLPGGAETGGVMEVRMRQGRWRWRAHRAWTAGPRVDIL